MIISVLWDLSVLPILGVAGCLPRRRPKKTKYFYSYQLSKQSHAFHGLSIWMLKILGTTPVTFMKGWAAVRTVGAVMTRTKVRDQTRTRPEVK